MPSPPHEHLSSFMLLYRLSHNQCLAVLSPCRSPPPPRAPRYRSPPRSRRPPPTTGLHIFAAGLNFIINEKVRKHVICHCLQCSCAGAVAADVRLICCALQDLERKFEKYGPVKDARIVRNPRSGESRGFGFLIMEHDDDVDRVWLVSVCLQLISVCAQ